MPDLQHHFSHAASVMPVADMERSLHFYRDQLGFELSFTWQEPVSYAIVRGGENVQIHLSLRDQPATGDDRKNSRVMIYVFVHDIDGLYQTYQERKVKIKTPIGDRDYKMRDFDVEDPDGHLICFGAG
ncbi:bleomycin resistance protein [Flavilitoribacter nigricans]|uniref:Bleomycin resistance protein n=1 Tax=Flavilitoribacter nigricans (strain ATCC 23147 / DSM 23189 / NBRC 102662 / NCIMB 1420 / SS-2) TaxID=1122177 RepID=A0A2D0NHR6_FLAN2|nr:VOC family protein [Flavilitoribacter nigricans]PHN08021.1 glyoxalase [Flavilitoribacter nigricans DSM 23189 = NBRC 102662]